MFPPCTCVRAWRRRRRCCGGGICARTLRRGCQVGDVQPRRCPPGVFACPRQPEGRRSRSRTHLRPRQPEGRRSRSQTRLRVVVTVETRVWVKRVRWGCGGAMEHASAGRCWWQGRMMTQRLGCLTDASDDEQHAPGKRAKHEGPSLWERTHGSPHPTAKGKRLHACWYRQRLDVSSWM